MESYKMYGEMLDGTELNVTLGQCEEQMAIDMYSHICENPEVAFLKLFRNISEDDSVEVDSYEREDN